MKSKRIYAFLIDMLIVSLLVSFLISSKITNPRLDLYNETMESYTKMATSLTNGDMLSTTKLIDMMYKMEYSMFFNYIIYIGLSFFYFVIFQSMAGQTLGKKLMKVEIRKIDGEKADFFTLFKRYLLGGLTYFSGVHILIISKVILMLALKEASIYATSMFGVCGLALDITNIVLLFKGKDERTLADKFAKTKEHYLVEKTNEI